MRVPLQRSPHLPFIVLSCKLGLLTWKNPSIADPLGSWKAKDIHLDTPCLHTNASPWHPNLVQMPPGPLQHSYIHSIMDAPSLQLSQGPSMGDSAGQVSNLRHTSLNIFANKFNLKNCPVGPAPVYVDGSFVTDLSRNRTQPTLCS